MKRVAVVVLVLIVAGCAARRPAPVVDRMLKLLLRQKALVRVDVLLFHDEALKRLKAEVTGLKSGAGAAAVPPSEPNAPRRSRSVDAGVAFALSCASTLSYPASG